MIAAFAMRQLLEAIAQNPYCILIAIAQISGNFANAGQLNTFINLVITALQPLAFTIIVAIALGDILDALLNMHNVQEGISVNIIFRGLIRLIVCYVLVRLTPAFANAACAFWNWFLDQANTIVSLSATTTMRSLGDGPAGWIWQIFIVVLPGLISVITQLLCAVLLAVQILTVKVEFVIRLCFMPIGLSAVISDGMRGAGIRYFKKTLACACYMGSIILVIWAVYLCTLGVEFGHAADTAVGVTGVAEVIFSVLVTMVMQSLVGPFAVLSCINVMKNVVMEAFGG